MNSKCFMMLVAASLLCVTVVESAAQPSVGGIVYGPQGAFNIGAPKGWVLDPSAGATQGLPFGTVHELERQLSTKSRSGD